MPVRYFNENQVAERLNLSVLTIRGPDRPGHRATKYYVQLDSLTH